VAVKSAFIREVRIHMFWAAPNFFEKADWACKYPVYYETDSYLGSPVFKKVWNYPIAALSSS